MRIWPVLLLLCAITMNAGAQTSSATDDLQQALTAYTQAQNATQREQRLAAFQTAEQLFASAAAKGFGNAEVYANQGTAALQAERLGAAIAAFRQALQQDPNHVRARLNLIHARSLLPLWVPKPQQDIFDSFFSWQRAWSLSERITAAAVCFLLTALLIAVAIGWRVTMLRGIAVLPGLLWLALLISVAADIWFAGDPPGVVIVDETLARAADSINAPAAFAQPLPEGTEVDVQELRRDWAKVALADGRSVWVPRSSLMLLDSPGSLPLL
jgi:tetratricopeptide (TPR) repeat protein